MVRRWWRRTSSPTRFTRKLDRPVASYRCRDYIDDDRQVSSSQRLYERQQPRGTYAAREKYRKICADIRETEGIVAGDGERGDRKRGWNRANSRELPCYDHVRLSRVAVVYTEPTRSLSCECRERVLSVCFSVLCLRLREPTLSPSRSLTFHAFHLSLSLSRSDRPGAPLFSFQRVYLSRSVVHDQRFPSLSRSYAVRRPFSLYRARESLTCEVSKTSVPSYVLRHCATRPTRSPTLCHYAGFRGSLWWRGESASEQASEPAS